jgi:RNA polymerase sigma-70 factor (ECF subfamily)
LDSLRDAAQRVVRGDAAAFRHIVEQTSDRLVRLALRILGDRSEAEDVVQEAFVNAHRALSQNRFDFRAGIETWLYRVVTHAAVDAARGRARRQRLVEKLDVATPSAEFDIEAHLALQRLSDWLGQLPKEQAEALVLKAVEGLSSAEVAQILQCSEGAVEQRLVRARATLRQRSAADSSAANSSAADDRAVSPLVRSE